MAVVQGVDFNNAAVDVVVDPSAEGAGTGGYGSFLRLQHNNDEEAFNNDDPDSPLLDEKDSFTTSIQYGSVGITTNPEDEDDTTEYVEFHLDLNENVDAEITLNDLKI